MNREQLRNQIAKTICKRDSALDSADAILSLEPLATILKKLDETREICPPCEGIGRAIYMERYSPEPTDVEPVEDTCSRCLGSGLGDWRIEKLVRLDDDQTLSKLKLDIHIWRDYSPDMAYEKAIEDVLQSGFRKVKL